MVKIMTVGTAARSGPWAPRMRPSMRY